MNWRFWKNGDGANVRISKVPPLIARVEGTDALDVSPATLKNYRDIARRLIDYFGDIDVTTIDRQQMASFDRWLRERPGRGGRPVAPVTLNGYLRRVRAVWNRLDARGVPVCQIDGLFRQVATGHTRSRAASLDEIQRIIARCCVRDAAMILLTARAGIRRQTLPRIRTQSVKIWRNADGLARLAASIPTEKTSAPRVIFAKHDAAVLVEAWLAVRQFDSEFLFNRMESPEPITVGALSHVWRRAVQRANLPDSATAGAWHSLRHFFAQDKLDDGHDARLVAEWMGINVKTLLEVYANPRLDRLAHQYFGEAVPHDVLVNLDS